MLDYDLAEIYGYEVKRLNEKGDRRGTNIKKLPFAFTEQGIYMLARVLRGEFHPVIDKLLLTPDKQI